MSVCRCLLCTDSVGSGVTVLKECIHMTAWATNTNNGRSMSLSTVGVMVPLVMYKAEFVFPEV